MKNAILDTWTESESGWGQKPDGCSIHLSKEDYKKYIKDYWDSMPDSAPVCYERPDGGLREIVVSNKLFKKIEKSNGGIRLCESELREIKEKNEILFKD
jgi:hypothetical protein